MKFTSFFSFSFCSRLRLRLYRLSRWRKSSWLSDIWHIMTSSFRLSRLWARKNLENTRMCFVIAVITTSYEELILFYQSSKNIIITLYSLRWFTLWTVYIIIIYMTVYNMFIALQNLSFGFKILSYI